jgi:hypothetical protein
MDYIRKQQAGSRQHAKFNCRAHGLKIKFWSLSETVKAPGTNDARSGMVLLRGAELMRKPSEAARVMLSYLDEAASAKEL